MHHAQESYFMSFDESPEPSEDAIHTVAGLKAK
jgi:hypothetical protein